MPTSLTDCLKNKEEAKEVYFDLDMVIWRLGDEPLLSYGFNTKATYKEAYQEDQTCFVNSGIIQTMNELYDEKVNIHILTASTYEKESVLDVLKAAGFHGTISTFSNDKTLLEDFLDRHNLLKDAEGYIGIADQEKPISEEVIDLIDENITNIDNKTYTKKSQFRPLCDNQKAFLVDDEERHGFDRMIWFDDDSAQKMTSENFKKAIKGQIFSEIGFWGRVKGVKVIKDVENSNSQEEEAPSSLDQAVGSFSLNEDLKEFTYG